MTYSNILFQHISSPTYSPCSAYTSPLRWAHPMCASKIALKRKILRHKSTKIAMQIHNMPTMEVMNRLIESEVSKRQVRKNVHSVWCLQSKTLLDGLIASGCWNLTAAGNWIGWRRHVTQAHYQCDLPVYDRMLQRFVVSMMYRSVWINLDEALV